MPKLGQVCNESLQVKTHDGKSAHSTVSAIGLEHRRQPNVLQQKMVLKTRGQ
jgi:hypothetical protein